jgi:RNA polymerase sigma-70 factor (ECF subfamily)
VDLGSVRDPKSFLAKVVARQALNALRAHARRREDYVGPWLPEPLLLDEHDPAADVVLAESISTAMLVVLETLSPDERAVFVLREVFGFDYDDIGSAVGRPTATVRQIAHRAREHVQSRRRRFEPIDETMALRITTDFLAAATTGDVEQLMATLAPDVVWTADSNGKASAARRPVLGAEKVAKLVLGLLRTAGSLGRIEPAVYNNTPAMVLRLDDHLECVITLEITDGRITNLYAMRNPDKLAAASVQRAISR